MNEGSGGKKVEDSPADETAELIEMVPAIRRYALFLTRYNVQDADDLLQDTLVRAFESVDKQYKRGTNLKAWVMRIAHNRFMDICRRATTRSDNQQTLELEAKNRPTSLDPLEKYEFKEVSDAFEELPDKYRRSLFLIAVEQFNYSEAAGILEVPIGTVKSRVARARKLLKEQLEWEGQAPSPKEPCAIAISEDSSTNLAATPLPASAKPPA